MAYNLRLAERIRSQLDGVPFAERKMFGGIGFLLNGNMVCGVHKDSLMVRIDPEKQIALLKKSHTKPFDLTGKPMKGWLLVAPEGWRTDKQLSAWIKESMEFVSTLPAK